VITFCSQSTAICNNAAPATPPRPVTSKSPKRIIPSWGFLSSWPSKWRRYRCGQVPTRRAARSAAASVQFACSLAGCIRASRAAILKRISTLAYTQCLLLHEPERPRVALYATSAAISNWPSAIRTEQFFNLMRLGLSWLRLASRRDFRQCRVGNSHRGQVDQPGERPRHSAMR
jgi:hypothetical protein